MDKKPQSRHRRAAIRNLLNERSAVRLQAAKPAFVFTRDMSPEELSRQQGHGSVGHSDYETSIEGPDALFVLDPEDLVDLSLEEVAIVWERRSVLCGSPEAAAEALAILRVADGSDEQYLGWRAYIDHAEVLRLSAAPEVPGQEEIAAKDIEPSQEAAAVDSPLFVREPLDVGTLTADDVRVVWDRRRELCGSLEAAAEVLAVLRAAKGTDTHNRGWRAFMAHPSILDLTDELDLLWPQDTDVTEPRLGVDDLLVDLRTVGVRNVRVRNGQANFRDEVLAFHGYACCVTGCVERDVLEAAHIIPFKGEQSNDVRNGLALRVDIHRLFDRWLISIDPTSFEVRVAAAIVDPAYRALDGRRLFRRNNAPDRNFLLMHYKQFMERAPVA